MMAPQLKVVHPADTPPPEDPSLADVWRGTLLPRKRREGITRDVLKAHERAIRAWEAFANRPAGEGSKGLTLCQALSRITADDLQAFQDYLIDQGTGARTVNLHVMYVRSILKAHAAAHGHSAVPSAPIKLREGKSPKIYFSLDDVSKLYDACEVATWPERGRDRTQLTYSAAAGWRFLICWWYNYGPRTQELYGHKVDASPILWRQTTRDQVNPSEAGQAISEHGWFWYTPSKQERFKADELVLPLTAITRAHLESVRPTHGADPGRPILFWPRGYDQFRRQWDAIVEASGVQAKPNLKTGKRPKLTPKYLRKTATTWLNVHRRGIAPFIVGHAGDRSADGKVLSGGDSKVSAVYYDNQENAVLEALTTFPQPESFSKVFDHGRPRQKTLF